MDSRCQKPSVSTKRAVSVDGPVSESAAVHEKGGFGGQTGSSTDIKSPANVIFAGPNKLISGEGTGFEDYYC